MRLLPALAARLTRNPPTGGPETAIRIDRPLIERFVPEHRPVPAEYIQQIGDLLASKARLLVLTGAGISTESGIPDYRSAGVGMYARPEPHRPIQHLDFVRNAVARRRYWARNYVAWPRFSAFRPNATHATLARWQRAGRLSGIITQNVDRLHQQAGADGVLDLHGHSHAVRCLGRTDGVGRPVTACDYRVDRDQLQRELRTLNGAITCAESEADALRPDGDVDVPDELMSGFRVPACPRCGGLLKPDVVFFGDFVPKERLQRVQELLAGSDALLVLGSSLQILSGYRIVVDAHERGLPVVIVNIGPTRADAVATMKLSAKCGDVVPLLQLDGAKH